MERLRVLIRDITAARQQPSSRQVEEKSLNRLKEKHGKATAAAQQKTKNTTSKDTVAPVPPVPIFDDDEAEE